MVQHQRRSRLLHTDVRCGALLGHAIRCQRKRRRYKNRNHDKPVHRHNKHRCLPGAYPVCAFITGNLIQLSAHLPDSRLSNSRDLRHNPLRILPPSHHAAGNRLRFAGAAGRQSRIRLRADYSNRQPARRSRNRHNRGFRHPNLLLLQAFGGQDERKSSLGIRETVAERLCSKHL